MKLRRGDIVWVEFRNGSGHVQRGRRPCLIVSTNLANGSANTFNVLPGTTSIKKKRMSYHLFVKSGDICGYMGKDTLFLTEQVTTIDKEQILCKAGYLKEECMWEADRLLIRQLGIDVKGGDFSA